MLVSDCRRKACEVLANSNRENVFRMGLASRVFRMGLASRRDMAHSLLASRKEPASGEPTLTSGELTRACGDFKRELVWTPGELVRTGEQISLLELGTCMAPSGEEATSVIFRARAAGGDCMPRRASKSVMFRARPADGDAAAREPTSTLYVVTSTCPHSVVTSTSPHIVRHELIGIRDVPVLSSAAAWLASCFVLSLASMPSSPSSDTLCRDIIAAW